MPVPVDLQDHYGVPPEEYWKEDYFRGSDTYLLDVIVKFKELAGFRRGMSALDIGAGLGKAMVALERAGFDTHGFEPSKPFRDGAIGRMGIDPARLRQGDMETIQYEPQSFDFITFGAVLEHLYDPSGSIRRTMEWLRPGGLIHIEVPSSDWIVGRIINFLYWLQGSDYVGNISPMHPPFHLYEFGLASFQMNGSTVGYTVVHSERFVCQTFMPRMLDPLLRTYMKRTGTGMQLAVWLRKREQ